MKSKTALLAVSTLAALAFGASAHAAQFVQNGDFESTLTSLSSQFGSLFPSQQVTDWSTNGYNFVFNPGDADTVGASGDHGNLKLKGPGDGFNNGLPATSPAGGKFIAADPVFEVGSIDQTINGLTAGMKYVLSFWYAGAQQTGHHGATTEGWKVSLGSETHSTLVLNNANGGFTGWQLATMSFTATGASEVLSFLAIGGPKAAQPPFSLLDGVSLRGGVPEPATWAMVIVGFGGIGAMVRRRRATAVTA